MAAKLLPGVGHRGSVDRALGRLSGSRFGCVGKVHYLHSCCNLFKERNSGYLFQARQPLFCYADTFLQQERTSLLRVALADGF